MPSFRKRQRKPKRNFKRTFVAKKKLSAGVSQTKTDNTLYPNNSRPLKETQVTGESPEVNELEREIRDRTQELQKTLDQNLTAANSAPAVPEIPAKFDGIKTNAERWQLLQAELLKEQKNTINLSHQLEMLKREFDKEREEAQKIIRDLKRDLHRSQPLHEHTFFTLSKELKESMAIMDQLVKDPGQNNLPITPEQLPVPPAAASQETAQTLPAVSAGEPKREVINESKEAPIKKKPKKVLLTGAVIAIILALIGGVSLFLFFKEPRVDNELVNEYLKNSGQVAGTTQTGLNETDKSPAPSEAAADLSQTDVPFENTVWAKLNESVMGISFEYPQNAVKINKTDSSITLIRKDGYIFKVTKVNTGLGLDEYWQQIKATNPNYLEEETKFNGYQALALSLQEIADFPGDRYLVKIGESIFDIWYATASENYDKDDLLRVKRILETVKFTNAE